MVAGMVVVDTMVVDTMVVDTVVVDSMVEEVLMAAEDSTVVEEASEKHKLCRTWPRLRIAIRSGCLTVESIIFR
jgi:hypothetical protein